MGIEDEDSKESAHKEQFTALVREVKGVLNANNCPNLTVSILPHVNSSGNYMRNTNNYKYEDVKPAFYDSLCNLMSNIKNYLLHNINNYDIYVV